MEDAEQPVAKANYFLIVLPTYSLVSRSISFILQSFRLKLIEQQRFPSLLLSSPSAHICHFLSCLLSFTFHTTYSSLFAIIQHFFSSQLSNQPTSSLLLFSQFSPLFCNFPKAQDFCSEGLYKLQGDCLQAHNIKQKMFSSGTRVPTCKHDIKAMMHRIESDRHTALNSHRVEARGNLHMGSPYKNATPGRTHSKSRQKKLSANKLFSKAHQISDNETYLTHSKSNEPFHAKQTRSNSGHCSDCLHTKKTKVLELCQQFNIKVGGEVDNNTLSLIIEKYGFYGITIDDLSSIHQNSDDSTLTSENTSLIDLIVKS